MTRFANSGSVQDFLVSTENYGDIAAQAVHDFHMQNLTSMQADGLMAKTDIEAGTIEDLGKINRKAIRSTGSTLGDAAMVGGVLQGVKGLALGGIKAGQSSTFSTPSATDLSGIYNNPGLNLGQFDYTPGFPSFLD